MIFEDSMGGATDTTLPCPGETSSSLPGRRNTRCFQGAFPGRFRFEQGPEPVVDEKTPETFPNEAGMGALPGHFELLARRVARNASNQPLDPGNIESRHAEAADPQMCAVTVAQGAEAAVLDVETPGH